MSRIVIVVADKFCSVDGVGYTGVDMTSIGLDIHAVQWFGTQGWIEFKPVDFVQPPNETITDMSRFDSVLASWETIDYQHKHPAPPPPPTPEQIIAQYTAGVQQHLDTFAQTRNYDSILSAATYATSQVPKFAAEGQYAVEARDATWAKCYEIMAAVEAGSRPMPTLDELLSELPKLVWPQ